MRCGRSKVAFFYLGVFVIPLHFNSRADVLPYQTGFESPDFHSGGLVGQGGWLASGGWSSSAAQVASSSPGQIVQIAGANIQQVSPNFYSGWFTKNLPYNPLTANTPRLTVRADFRLNLGTNAASSPWLFAFLILTDQNGNAFSSIGLDKVGAIFGQNFANPDQVAVAPTNGANAWHNLQADLDFGSRQVAFSMDGVGFGTMPFNPASGNSIGAVQIVLQSATTIDSTLLVDNLVVAPQSYFSADQSDCLVDDASCGGDMIYYFGNPVNFSFTTNCASQFRTAFSFSGNLNYSVSNWTFSALMGASTSLEGTTGPGPDENLGSGATLVGALATLNLSTPALIVAQGSAQFAGGSPLCTNLPGGGHGPGAYGLVEIFVQNVTISTNYSNYFSIGLFITNGGSIYQNFQLNPGTYSVELAMYTTSDRCSCSVNEVGSAQIGVFGSQALPVITSQPTNQTNAVGTQAAFSVTAFSYSPVTYQWQRRSTNLQNGTNISGAATSTLTINSVGPTDAADYRVIISNSAGAVTSTVATLTVLADLSPIQLRWNDQGSIGFPVYFQYTNSGGPTPNATTAQLFWAAGTNISDILSPTPIYTDLISTHFTGASSTNFVPASSLANPPAGTTHIVLLLDRNNLIAESNKTNNIAAMPFMQNGIDISYSAGEPSIADFQNILSEGYQFAIVQGWGGVTANSHAIAQLRNARTAGMITAGYCYLNFNSIYDGARQARNALSAFADEAAYLGFVAVDVETNDWSQISSGLKQTPPDAGAQSAAVVLIGQAVNQISAVGLRPVIYTKKSDWRLITGDTSQFSALLLWHTQTTGGSDITQPDLSDPSFSFGGWTKKSGKQYLLDTFLNSPPLQVDLDVFYHSTFSANNSTYHPLDLWATLLTSGGTATLSWNNSAATLEEAPTPVGPWTPVVGAISPFPLRATESQHFFRVR